MKETHRQKAEILKALGHPIRFCIVEGLLAGERNVADLVGCLKVPQPTVSQHLHILKAAGILECSRTGNQMHYSVRNDDVRRIIAALNK
jgi:DNA-binding transcriptional ArsR family regulator